VTISPLQALLVPGATQRFAATVTGSTNTAVNWSVQEGVSGGAITSAGVYTAPASSGTFHVVGTSTANPTISSSALVTVASASGPTNQLGINIGGTLDWLPERLYANVVPMSREFMAPGTNGNGPNRVPVDGNGWPTTDFSFYAWADIDQMHGTYALSFQGQAVVAGPVGAVPVSYDPTTNTSTGTLNYTVTTQSFLYLDFSQTKRTSSSAAGSGVTQIKLMRPLSPGSSQSYPVSELFNRATKAELSKFRVLRFMDFSATNWSVQTNWSDRPLPSWASFQRNPGGNYGWQGIGGPWEHVVRLSNELHTDAWINIPARATDDYVLKVARLFAYGSDGVNPYASQQSNPVYPPLDGSSKIYVEYSNEVWNSIFTQFNDNCKAASDELVSMGTNSPLNFDKSWNGVAWIVNDPAFNPSFDYEKCWRRIAKRGAEISTIFRSVFGDAAMMTRIRPVLMTQQGDAQGTFSAAMKMMFAYYNNGEGNFVSNPHPPSYYFYGAGGSGYYGPPITVTTLDTLFAGMTPTGWAPQLKIDAAFATAMGLKRVCYEGGPSLDRTNGPRDPISAQAVNDPRMTTTVVNMHNAWSSSGGELLMYYQATGDYQWGFTDNIYRLLTPKLQAIDQLGAAAPAPVTFGTTIPGNTPGNTPSVCSSPRCYPIPPTDIFNANSPPGGLVWASYTFIANEAGTRSVVLTISMPTAPQVGVYVDGVLIGTQSASGSTLTFDAGVLGRGPHGVLVRAVAGSFMVDRVSVQ
jgi:hypothetical protein